MRDCSTDSFRMASFLVAVGCPIAGTSKAGRKTRFKFQDTQALRDAVQEFRFGDPEVSVRDLFSAQSQIKSLIFDAPFAGGDR